MIAITGIGCMLALWVRERTREIGIRMALGAAPGQILGGVLRQGMALVAHGVAGGLAGALLFTRLIRKLHFQTERTQLPTYPLVSAPLLAAATVPCMIPARRASRVDPQIALRSE